MRNLFILNSPLQYLLARTIADRLFAGSENSVIQYIDNGDFRASFDQIDQSIGPHAFAQWWQVEEGGTLPDMTFDRIFMSNRFNPTEIYIALSMRKKTRMFCAFEDGISIYLGHYFLDKDMSEANPSRRRKNAAKIAIFNAGITIKRKPDFIPFAYFSEVYTVYPDVPHVAPSAKRISIADDFAAICMGDAAATGDAQRPSSCVLLSQSLTTDRLIGEDDLVAFVSTCIGELKQRYDRVYFKPHPRDPAALKAVAERMEVLGITDDLKLCPVELFVARNPGIDIYGFWSSTLAYSPIFGASSYSFGDACTAAFPANDALRAAWQANRLLMDRYGVQPYSAGASA